MGKMGKIVRNLIAGLLISLLLCVSASASSGAPSVIDPDRTGSITIYKIRENDGRERPADALPDPSVSNTGMEGIVFRAVKVADITAAADENGTGTYFGNADSSFIALLGSPAPKTVGGKTVYTAESLLDALAARFREAGAVPGEEAVRGFVRAASGSAARTFPATGADGGTSLSGLPQGLYLVAETDWSGYMPKPPAEDPDRNSRAGTDEAVYSPASPFFVMLPMTNVSVSGADGGTSWLYDVTVYPKNSTVTIPKYIVSEDDGDSLIFADDAEIGEAVRQITAPSAPAVTAAHAYEKYVVRDEMDEGLVFERLISVKLGPKIADPEKLSEYAGFTVLAEDTDYALAVSEDKHSFSVTFLEAGLAKLNAQTQSGQVVVEWDSVLDRNASETDPNTNRPVLAWKTKGAVESETAGNIPGVFTYRIELTKKGADDPSRITFRITRKSDKKTMQFAEEGRGSGIYHPFDKTSDRKADRTNTLRVSKDGVLILRGLDEDTYTFTELTTENGLSLLRSSFDVALSGNEPADGNLSAAAVTVDGMEEALLTEGGTAYITVENHPQPALRTGGAGNGILYSAAACFAVLACLFARRKKNAG